MTNTTNYNLLLAEGTDLVNYLTQTNPNFSNLDTIIKGVSDLTVTPATEVATGTAHAISKTLADATVIKFTATSNWQTGDTMTLDGTPVTPLKTDGTTLKTGDYIIGSAVLMIQDGTRLTVLVASSPDASDINYTNDGTHTWLTANKVEGAINEAASEIDTINSNLSDVRPIGASHLAGTTSSDGILNLTTDGKPIIYAIDSNNNGICLIGRSGNIHWVKVVNYALSPVANTPVDIYYYYLEPSIQ